MKHLGKIAALALCAGLLGGVSAQAGETSSTGRQISVSYADLDISHRAGAEALLQRIEVAASQVCGGQPDIRDLHQLAFYRACKKDAMDGAVASIGSPMVASLYGLPLPQVAERK